MPVSSKQIIDKNKKIKPIINCPMFQQKMERKNISPKIKPRIRKVKSLIVSFNSIRLLKTT